MYLDARYISASESIWRIFHYRMHNHTPNVQRLAVHLPNQQSVTFQDGDNLQHIVNNSTASGNFFRGYISINIALSVIIPFYHVKLYRCATYYDKYR